MNRRTRLCSLTALLLLLMPVALSAQEPSGAKVLTIEEYGRWRSVTGTALSADGRWVSFVYQQPRSDDHLVLRNLQDGTEFEVPRGSRPQFSDDGRWVVHTMSVAFEEAEKLRRDNRPVPSHMGLLDLHSGAQRTWEQVTGGTFSPGSGFLALPRAPSGERTEHQGNDLLLVNLASGLVELIGSVSQWAFNKSGTHLAYTVDARDQAGNGLYLVTLATGVRRVLDSEPARYSRLTWDREGTAVAVLRGTDDEKVQERINLLLAWTGLDGRTPVRLEYNPAGAAEFPEGMVISERAALTWSEDNQRLLLGIKEQTPKPERPDRNEEPIADVDIFHWQDDRLQTVQRIQANADRNRTHRAALLLASRRLVVLTDEVMRSLTTDRDLRWGIGSDTTPYSSDWKESQADYYRVEIATGARTRFLTGQGRTLGLSPDGRYFLYWLDGHVWSYTLQSDRHRNITEGVPVSFADMEWDYVGTRPPYGVAGWSADGRSVLLEHRYDLWRVPLEGGRAENLTGGTGDAEEIRFRYVRLDPQERTIDLSQPLLLSAYGNWTKKSGYYRLHRGRLESLVFEDRSYGRVQKAEKADRILFTRETFHEYPDLWASDLRFASPVQITDANPQQAEFRWGRRILFDFHNSAGVRLQATLAIPDGRQPGQRLPMLVNFYEKNSQNLHRYVSPRHASSPNFSGYVSAGYLVMQPDIHFNTGTSHSDMLDCVEAAVRQVIEMGYADPARVGLHGHSYSGGGASYIAGRSTLFAAIVAGAAPINLAGEFNILFSGSGQNNHRYDIHGQGRYGTDPFTDPELYREQSPITWAPTMDTPLIYLHGTDDPTVEYLQGMEFYNALRFLGKPVIFLSYPGEGHSLRRRENQIDFQQRIRQFYEHHLRGEPAPDWISHGRPYLQKPQMQRAGGGR